MTDLQIVTSYISAVFKNSDTVAVQDEEGIHVFGYTIWKDGEVYRLQKAVYFQGSYEEPPSEDLVDLGDTFTRLDDMVRSIVNYEIDEVFQNISEGIHYHQEKEFEDVQEVLES